ncbi:MAG: formate dehydrogenase accessory protein FdhE [Nitrospirota bacterium]
MSKIKEQVELLKRKEFVCKEILDFYEKVVEEQEGIKASINIKPLPIREDVKKLHINEGFPLISKEEFSLDIPCSIRLFEKLCKIGKNATAKMNKNILIIEDAVKNKSLSPDEFLSKFYDDVFLDKATEDLEIDSAIFKFLIHMSIRPSITANIEKLKDQVSIKGWFRGYCPICGSLPQISALKGEGQRYLICSFCGFEWQSERLKCPFCENKDHETLHYFYEDGQEVYRIDACNKCNKYIKTINSGKLAYEPDLNLEDIATFYLDIIALDKGFKKHGSQPWGF